MRNTLIFLVFLLASCHPKERRPAMDDTANDPLPSWQEGATKQAIIDFVTKTTKEGAKGFVPVADRIACFDNDGTLWSEQPMYFQLAFAFDQVKILAPQHPEWKNKQPYKSLLEGDLQTALAGGEKAGNTLRNDHGRI